MIRNAVGLGVVLIALSAPSVADAFRVYVRDVVPAWGVWPAPVMTMPPLR